MDTNANATTAVRPEPHPEWGDHSQSVLQKIDLRFVLSAWGWSVAATLVLAGLVSAIVVYAGGMSLTDPGTATSYGIGTIVFAFSTFIAFAVVLSVLLTRERGDRLVNSMAVSVLHVGAAIVLALAAVAMRLGTDAGAAGLVDAAWADLVGTTLMLLVQAAPAALFACLLAVGMVPTGGPPPAGTQHPELDENEW